LTIFAIFSIILFGRRVLRYQRGNRNP